MLTLFVLCFAIAVGFVSAYFAYQSGHGLLQFYYAYSGGGALSAIGYYIVTFAFSLPYSNNPNTSND